MLEDKKQNQQESLMKSFTMIGIGVLLIFAISNWIDHEKVISIIEAGMGLGLLLNLIIYNFHKKLPVTSLISVLIILLLLLTMYVTGGIGRETGVYWYFLFPVIAFYLLDKTEAYILLTILIVCTGLIYLLSRFGLFEIPYTWIETRQLLISFLVEGLLIGKYQNASGAYQEEIVRQREKLHLVNNELIEAMELSKKVQAELQTKHNEMDQSRSAMLNLLEDEKELKKQLEQEKENVEKEVKIQTSELRAVIESINRGLMVVDRNRKIVLKNNMIDLLLHKSKDYEYHEVVEFLASKVDIEKMVEDSFKLKKDSLAEAQLFDTRYLTVHTIPIMQDNGVNLAAIFVKDVTELVSLQRSRDEFFSIASHELRTPLTAIRGNSQMLIDQYGNEALDKDAKEMLSDIHEGSVRLIEIVNDFLNVSRLEMGKIEFKKVKVQLGKIVTETIAQFEGQLESASVKVKMQITGDQSLFVMADDDRLKQVLTNLLGNALKFSQKGTIEINLSVEGDLAKLKVIDPGEGIPKKMQGLLFHKFQQAGSSLYTRDTSRGTGLGLYISKLLIEGMGGKIWLEKSEIGMGSTFTLSLPIAKNSEA